MLAKACSIGLRSGEYGGRNHGRALAGQGLSVPDFSAAGKEMLGLFASQAAAAIVNAQAHQQEQRARADLEALIETAPVGVMVVDACTGRPVSSSRFCSGFRPAPHLPR